MIVIAQGKIFCHKGLDFFCSADCGASDPCDSESSAFESSVFESGASGSLISSYSGIGNASSREFAMGAIGRGLKISENRQVCIIPGPGLIGV